MIHNGTGSINFLLEGFNQFHDANAYWTRTVTQFVYGRCADCMRSRTEVSVLKSAI